MTKLANNTEVHAADTSLQRRAPEKLPPFQSRHKPPQKEHELRTRYEARLAAQIAQAELKA